MQLISDWTVWLMIALLIVCAGLYREETLLSEDRIFRSSPEMYQSQRETNISRVCHLVKIYESSHWIEVHGRSNILILLVVHHTPGDFSISASTDRKHTLFSCILSKLNVKPKVILQEVLCPEHKWYSIICFGFYTPSLISKTDPSQRTI